jgi:hypothetical protein
MRIFGAKRKVGNELIINDALNSFYYSPNIEVG